MHICIALNALVSCANRAKNELLLVIIILFIKFLYVLSDRGTKFAFETVITHTPIRKMSSTGVWDRPSFFSIPNEQFFNSKWTKWTKRTKNRIWSNESAIKTIPFADFQLPKCCFALVGWFIRLFVVICWLFCCCCYCMNS